MKKVLLTVFIIILVICVGCNNTPTVKTSAPSSHTASADEVKSLKGEYFDFAIKNRFEYVPLFKEGNAPTNGKEYLTFTLAINPNNKGQYKGTMTKEHVEDVIKSYFGVTNVVHKSLPRNFNYDGEKYIAGPDAGVYNAPVYILKNLKTSQINGKTIYDADMDYCDLVNGHIPRHAEVIKEIEGDKSWYTDLETIKKEITNGNDSFFKVLYTERFVYYIDNGHPVFIKKEKIADKILLEQISQDKGYYTESYTKKYDQGKVALLDNNNNLLFSEVIDVMVLPYLYAVKYNSNEGYILIDKGTLKRVPESETYDEIFCEKYPDYRLSTIIMKGRKGAYWGLITAKGKNLMDINAMQFDEIRINTYEEVWPIIEVRRNGKRGAIDYNGKIIIEPKWTFLMMDVYNIRNTVFVHNGKTWGSIKLDKNLNTEPVDYSVAPPQRIKNMCTELNNN